MGSIKLDGNTLSTTEIALVAMGETVEVAADAWLKIEASRSVVDGILERSETVYGINTGFGALVSESISPDELVNLQVNLIRSHACAIGEPMSINDTRAMMCVRANSLIKGHSGIQRSVIEQLISYLNQNIVPVVPRIGSLGASGDLAPLSHMALALIGEGEVWGDEGPVDTSQILREKGLIAVDLAAKDGLSLINGTSQMCSLLVNAEMRLSNLLLLADLIACASIEARECSIRPMDPRVHKARPHHGQSLVAERITKIMKDSPNLAAHADCERVQDAYSFRCIPQVHGAVLERLRALSETLEIEVNSATDNPLIFPNISNPGVDEVISQGNFHGEVLALAADGMSHAIFELAHISERRIDQIVNPSQSNLPPFLAINSGLESGMMIVHYVAAAALSEMHGRTMPRSAFSTPTSGGQEDHVSMGATACWNLVKSSDHLAQVLACELIIACEALEYRKAEPANHVLALYRLVRKICPALEGDRSISKEIEIIASELANGGWLARIEAEHGRLPR
ncbi:MAG: histidine ammonia-lyase [Euryarchaeota archaeon]|jgi:histidine ammonia-lyase|nr:histidine ammonia-lyase [Euryarchaeota archaeon]MBT4982122.1 histidine ammonia-lyase [Euryarchaeota archaeon]MBT5184600.1 histidine ammonia-lyase [Euryarchaeota archaeon]